MERQVIEFYATQIVDSAIRVHKELGPGLLESVYQYCLAEELTLRRISVIQKNGQWIQVNQQGQNRLTGSNFVSSCLSG